MNVKLIMFRADGERRDFSIAPGVTTIGRKQDCTIRIPLAMVSRRHAELSFVDNRLTIRDLGAANGTFVNNQRVDQAAVKPGDQIAIGPVVFTVQVDGTPSDDEIIRVKARVGAPKSAKRGAAVATSKHVYMSDEDMDPIAALEALASSADQTAIEPNDDEFNLKD